MYTVYTILDNSSCRDVLMKRREMEAFISIEYSLLLPGILIMFTCLVCMGLYLHNQCVLQTNTYILSVEGARLDGDTTEQRIGLLQRKEMDIYNNKYILAEDMKTTYQLQGNKITISGNGRMANPFSILGLGKEVWTLSAESEFYLSSPADTLRLMKSVCGILENLPSKEESENDS